MNYKEIKQKGIGRMPKEWRVAQLEEVIGDIKNGFASGKRDANGIVQIRMNNVTTDGHLFFDSFLKVPVPENINEFLLKENDLLFNNTNSIDLVGKSAIFKNASFPCTFSNHFTRIRFRDGALPEWVLFHFIRLWRKGFFRSVAIRHVGQSAVQTKYLTNIRIPLPPLPEQKKITEVLTTVDQAIEKVDEAIEKTQRLKKGLMQELLTKGIGHKEFKDTEIGRIPKEWELRKLGEIGKLERGKFAYRPRNDPRFYGGKFPFIQTGDIGEANGVIKKYFQTLNEEGLKISKMFKKGTIVISIAGNIGDVGILDFDSCFPDSIVGIKGDSEKVNNLFLMYLLQKSKRGLDSIAPRSTQKNINLGILEAFKLPLPSLPEQQKITEILSAVDDRLGLLRARKERLGEIKKGLMNDLLTGRKRVKLD